MIIQQDIENKLTTYFGKEISPEEFARYMRRYMHVINMKRMQDTEDMPHPWEADGYYYLSQLVEALDPQLDFAEVHG